MRDVQALDGAWAFWRFGYVVPEAGLEPARF